MTLYKSLYRGKYTCQKSANKERPYIGLFLASAMLFIGIWLIWQNSKTVYELPGEEVPVLAVPPVNPVIGEELPVTELSHQAYYAQNVLTLVLVEMLDGNEQRSLVCIYDLKEGRELNVHELPERYLGISYIEFLYATDKYIGQRYSNYHASVLQYVPDTVIIEQQHRQNQNYIQTDPIHMLGRFTFPTNEGVYLLYEMPLITEEYDYEIPMQTVTEPIGGLLPCIDFVTPLEAVCDLLTRCSSVCDGCG